MKLHICSFMLKCAGLLCLLSALCMHSYALISTACIACWPASPVLSPYPVSDQALVLLSHASVCRRRVHRKAVLCCSLAVLAYPRLKSAQITRLAGQAHSFQHLRWQPCLLRERLRGERGGSCWQRETPRSCKGQPSNGQESNDHGWARGQKSAPQGDKGTPTKRSPLQHHSSSGKESTGS